MSNILYKDSYKDYTIEVRQAGGVIVTEINKKHRTEYTPIIFDNGVEGVELTLRIGSIQIPPKDLRKFTKEITLAHSAIEHFSKHLYIKGLTDTVF